MWKKDRKKLKKELSLNYTVMLLPHSQDKPVHFKIPVWVFMAAFLSLFTLLSLTLFFSFASYRLRGAEKQKQLLESELKQLESERALLNEEKERLVGDNLKIAEENADLMESQKEQEAQLDELKALSEQVTQELEELNKREKGIRDKLGLEEDSAPQAESMEAASSPDRSDLPDEAQTGGPVFASQEQVYDIAMCALPGAENLVWRNMPSASAQSLEDEFIYLKNSIKRQENSFNSMNTKIEQVASERQKSQIRNKIVSYALQFVGNSYVYGGNDPHSGVDCSGFSRYVLSHVAGVSLNRTSSSQSRQGSSVSISDARPGDLIFYGSGGNVSHVAIYIGNGRVVHASNERTGIIVSNWNYRTPIAIKDVID